MRKALVISIIFAGLLCSCEKSLDLQPEDFLSPDGFSNENDIKLALTGTYKALTGMGESGGDYQNIDPIITDFITDNGFMDKSWMGVVEFWDQGQTANSSLAERKWSRNYMGILRANTVLKYIDQVSFSSPELRQRYKAEARFLRAFFYSDLIQYFGSVPLRLEPDGLEAQHLGRTSKEAIVDFIYQELDSALLYLPETYSDEDHGRVTSGAAGTLKTWVALNNYDYELAITASEEVILSGVYEIYPDYQSLFLAPAEALNKEIIFDAQYLEGKTEENLTSPWTTYFYAWASFQADYSLISEYYMNDGSPAVEENPAFDPGNPFADRDPRLSLTITLPYTFDGYTNLGDINTFIPYNKKAYNFTSLRIRKWVDYEEEHNLRGKKQSGTNNIFFRYADLLLMRAEALCEFYGAGYETEIVSLVDEVRRRQSVSMPAVGDSEGSGLTQEELRNIIRHERRVELAFEGSRIIDIARWDIGNEAYSNGQGYDPNLLYYYVVTDEIYENMVSDGLIPSSMLRYLGNSSYFLNKILRTESDFRDKMEAVFTPANGFDNNELEEYGDLLLAYVEPKYQVYDFRLRTFNTEKGYLWPIPYSELQSNDEILSNNPGY